MCINTNHTKKYKEGIMKKTVMFFITLILLSGTYYGYNAYQKKLEKPEKAVFKKTAEDRKGGPKAHPNANYWEIRSYPNNDIDIRAYQRGLVQANDLKQELISRKDAHQWELVGPTNVGGRISDLAIDENNTDIIWSAAASGGVWKSEDKGLSWNSMFDDQSVLTIGAIAIDPINSNIVYAGTGEASASSFSFYGNGIYKTADAGLTWDNVGLENSSYISRIRINPVNPEIVYACATGKLYSTDANRGVYRSMNGGADWEKVLFISDSTAANDLVIDPVNPQIIYASMWERTRTLNGRKSGGITSGIYKSTDGGDSWNKLTNGFPEDESVGRIGLAISRQNPEKLYAVYADYTPAVGSKFGGVYKTVNGGESWSRCSTDTDHTMDACYSSFGWYFSKIEVDPKNDDKVFVLGVSYHMTKDGGDSWQILGGYNEYFDGTGPHVDHHAIAISPTENFFIDGNDGGIVLSNNEGTSITKIKTAISQFYALEVDDNDAKRMIGGTQDNGTNFTQDGSIDGWEHVLGGDGFQALISPVDGDILFAESQNGYMTRSTDGGNEFYGIEDGLSEDDRFQWNTPLLFHPNNGNIVYCGSQYVYKSDDASSADYSFQWEKISPDLTDGNGHLHTIAPAPSDEEVIYAGTTHSNVWVTKDGGANWINISENLPNRWVTRIVVDWQDPAIAYVSFSGLRWDSNLSYIFKTTNYGESWTDITNNLPQLPVNCIEVNKNDSNMLFVGSDIGVYVSKNGGESWQASGLGLPNAPAYDLKVHYKDNLLFVGTYGRSAYKISLEAFNSIEEEAVVDKDFAFLSNYPNPFNNQTRILIKMKNNIVGKLVLYNSAGRRIATLFEGNLKKGDNLISVDAAELKLASGVYLAKLTGKNFSKILRMNYLK